MLAGCDNQSDHVPKGASEEHGGNLRYIGYLRTIGLVVSKGTRYLAYTSDVGEAFRPVVPSRVVNLAYLISWSYVLGDVGFHGIEEYKNKAPREKSGN